MVQTKGPAYRRAQMSSPAWIRTAARLVSAWLVLSSAFVTSCGLAHAAGREHVVESAADWEQAYNAWEESHGAPDRIVAFVDRGGRSGVRVLEVQMSWQASGGTVVVCGWFAIRASAGRNPGHQIAGDGREDCSRFRRAAAMRTSSVA